MSLHDYSLFIGGALIPATARERLERRSPANGHLVATYPCATEAEVNMAVGAAKRAFESSEWRGLSPAQRSFLLSNCAEAVRAAADRLARVIAAEVGKSLEHALAEVLEGCALWRYAAASLRSQHGEFYPALDARTQAYTMLEPVGVVGLITPWNFPFLVSAERLPFILAAGCTVVAKPSEYAGGCAFITGELLKQGGLPDGVYNVISGWGYEAGTALVSSPDVDMISFTGSTENGRRVAELAGRSLKRVSLELGGKSPIIVFADADLEEAAEAVISGFTYNAGQCCIATSRLILERSIAPKFKKILVDRLDRAATQLLQPVATETQHKKVVEYIETGKREGDVLYGGDFGKPGTPIPATVFDSISSESRLSKEEIFGPVLSVYHFDSDDDAVRLANETVYGLAACVWTRDVNRAMRIVSRVRAGRLWINSPQVNFPELPVGGFRSSGVGREAGTTGIRTYCEVKSVILRR